MIDSKTRSKLRALASKEDAIFQIGKGGVSDNLTEQISEALEARELVKITVLNNSDFSAKDMMSELARTVRAEEVCTIGNKIVLYRRSRKSGVRHVLAAPKVELTKEERIEKINAKRKV